MRRECNSCDWIGKVSECVFCGEVGPLCPICHGTTMAVKGRPTLPPDQAQTAMIRERVTQAQREEYEARGGKGWLVAALNRKRK